MLLLVFAALLALLTPFCAAQHATLPVDLQGELEGVPYRICVPGNWNGTLLVYAHGYGEVVTPPAVTPLDLVTQTLLNRGFALAASRFAGTGWTVKEGMQNTAALTAAFNGIVGRPRRTVIWGKSMGGLMTLGLIEKFHGLYDGAIAMCPPAAGTPRRFDQALDIALAYAVAFGWPTEWGTPGDIRDDLDFTAQVLPHMQARVGQTGGWEFIRLVNKIPPDRYYEPLNFRFMCMYFATAVRAEIEDRARGPIAENIGRVYSLTDAEKASLTVLGVDADALLAEMNARTNYAAPPNARNYAEHYVNPSGRINRPVLAMHTKGDALATPTNEGAYRATVDQAGNSDLLMQQFTNGVAHCTFTHNQIITGVDAMVQWLDTGSRPDPALFFTSALGFDPSYIPPPWPW